MLLSPTNIPKHVAIIMDGNGRWAESRKRPRFFGHKEGVKAVERTLKASSELGIEYLTLYAFSTENWNRPKEEVVSLMSLLATAIDKNIPKLLDAGVQLKVMGNIESLPDSVVSKLDKAVLETSKNKGLTLILALSYSARWELTNATKQIAKKVLEGDLDVNKIDDQTLEEHLTSSGIPDPELMIRTSGEQRISNFLLWQLAYSELYFTDTLWPDFGKDDLVNALIDYQSRERRFGKIKNKK